MSFRSFSTVLKKKCGSFFSRESAKCHSLLTELDRVECVCGGQSGVGKSKSKSEIDRASFQARPLILND